MWGYLHIHGVDPTDSLHYTSPCYTRASLFIHLSPQWCRCYGKRERERERDYMWRFSFGKIVFRLLCLFVCLFVYLFAFAIVRIFLMVIAFTSLSCTSFLSWFLSISSHPHHHFYSGFLPMMVLVAAWRISFCFCIFFPNHLPAIFFTIHLLEVVAFISITNFLHNANPVVILIRWKSQH